ncbi:MAG TPA: VOC family protein [Pyrinomonadaceae bacterium]|nr:VOC family protein [Pyrinomonadaceae bacterium]
MFKNTEAFSSFSVNDIEKAHKFYGETLGVNVSKETEGLALTLGGGGGSVFIYPKEDHEAATFTVLNFKVGDLEKTVDDLTASGIKFESFEGEMKTDEKGIFHGGSSGNGPNIAWFKDPSGNFLAVIEV